MKKLTISEVANRAGVSTATVSRILNGQDNVTPKTRDHVLSVMSDMNFELPIRIRCQNPPKFGMAIAGYDDVTPQSSFFHEVIAGAGLEADQRRATFSFAPIYCDDLTESELLRRGDLDGLIVAGVPIPDETVMKLNRTAYPTVFIGRYLDYGEPLNYVTPDNVGGGRIAANFLFESGHRDICVLNGPEKINVFRDRILGVREFFSERLTASIREMTNFNEEAGYEAMKAVLDEKTRPTAVLALSDWMAIGAMRAIVEAGLRIPDDISVMGFSDLPIAEILNPPLTTIRIPQRKLGSLAVQLLDSLIRKEIQGPVGMILPPDLVVRQSTRKIEAKA